MARMPIYNSFHPILNKKTEPIKNIDGETKQLVDDMFVTMYNSDGIGLAANQVGVSKSLVIIDVSPSLDNGTKEAPIVMINPVIQNFSEEENEFKEGCLSVPLFYEKVIRPAQINIKYYDLNGKEHNREADGILATVMQHEVDHLSGTLFYEKLTPIRRSLAKNKLKKIKKGKTIPDYPMVLPDGTETKEI